MIKKDNFEKIENGSETLLKEPLKISKIKNKTYEFKKNTIVRNWSLILEECENITIKGLSIIHGDESVRNKNKKEGIDKPENSVGLDCLSISKCSGTINIVNCSFIASCDELISVTNGKKNNKVIVTNCLFAFPLADDGLHPYGRDKHAYCSNNSAVNIVYINCVFTGSIMRSPQFECSDIIENQTVYMGIYNSLIYSFTDSGTKLRTCSENDKKNKKNGKFNFSVVGNIYVNESDSNNTEELIPPILLDNKFGVFDESDLRIYIDNNWYSTFNNSKWIEIDSESTDYIGQSNDSPKINRKKLFTKSDNVSKYFELDKLVVDRNKQINDLENNILDNVGTKTKFEKKIIDSINKRKKFDIFKKLKDIEKEFFD